jgi:hypothetical protein
LQPPHHLHRLRAEVFNAADQSLIAGRRVPPAAISNAPPVLQGSSRVAHDRNILLAPALPDLAALALLAAGPASALALDLAVLGRVDLVALARVVRVEFRLRVRLRVLRAVLPPPEAADASSTPRPKRVR